MDRLCAGKRPRESRMHNTTAELSSLRALFDCFPTGVLVANNEARYVAVNEAASSLLGRSRDQLLGCHLSDIVAPGRNVDVRAQWQAFLREGTQTGSFELTLPNGQMRRIDFHAQANFVPGLHCSFLEAAKPIVHGTDRAHMLTMCAWTKRVKFQGQWIPVERYLAEQHGHIVTHGISPAASERYFGK